MILFDERGERAQKLFWLRGAGDISPGWIKGDSQFGINVLGFDPERTWRPTWAAVRMQPGYRVFRLDVGVHEYADAKQVSDWWEPADPRHKRLPHIAAVEMWIRHQAARDG